MKNIWIPLVTYETSGQEYLLHARKEKNGLISFNTTKITGPGCSYVSNQVPIKLNTQFTKVLNQKPN